MGQIFDSKFCKLHCQSRRDEIELAPAHTGCIFLFVCDHVLQVPISRLVLSGFTVQLFLLEQCIFPIPITSPPEKPSEQQAQQKTDSNYAQRGEQRGLRHPRGNLFFSHIRINRKVRSGRGGHVAKTLGPGSGLVYSTNSSCAFIELILPANWLMCSCRLEFS